jgi:hypothetical protein
MDWESEYTRSDDQAFPNPMLDGEMRAAPSDGNDARRIQGGGL